jgi:hypothetical protein
VFASSGCGVGISRLHGKNTDPQPNIFQVFDINNVVVLHQLETETET